MKQDSLWCALRVFVMLMVLTSTVYAACYLTQVSGLGVVSSEEAGIGDPKLWAYLRAEIVAKQACAELGGNIGKEIGKPEEFKLYDLETRETIWQCTRKYECEVCGTRRLLNPFRRQS